MAITYPTTLDAFSNPSASTFMDDTGFEHDIVHSNVFDAVEALEAKVGVNGSAVTTSLDYKTSKLITLSAIASPGVSAAGTGRIFFNTSVNRFQVSENAGAYRDLPLSTATFTAGKIPFAGSDGDLTEDTLFHYNDTVNAMGIGTATPGVLLGGHNMSTVPGVHVLSSTDGTRFILSSATTGHPSLMMESGNAIAGQRVFQFWHGAPGVTFRWFSETAGTLVRDTMVVTAAGEVLIGITAALTAGVPLQVAHDVGVNLIGIEDRAFGASANAANWSVRKTRGTSATTHAVVALNDGLLNINAGGSDGAAFLTAGAIRFAVDGTPGTNDMPGRIEFWTTSDGASALTERVRINSSGHTVLGVDIASTSLANLTVYGRASEKTAVLRANATSPGNVVEVQDSAGVARVTLTATGAIHSFNSASTVDVTVHPAIFSTSLGGIGTVTNNDFLLGTNNTERARVTTAGEFLIGTAATLASGTRLQVAADESVNVTMETRTFGAHAFGTTWNGSKTRNVSATAHTIVQDNDVLLSIVGRGSDGAAFLGAGRVRVAVDGTPGTNDMPGRLEFWTTADGASTPTKRWEIKSTGHLLAGVDNTHDIGASGATRPRTIFVGTSVVSPSFTMSGLTATRVVFVGAGGALTDDADLIYDAVANVLTTTGDFVVGPAGVLDAGVALQVSGRASEKTAIFRANATTPGNILELQNSAGTPLVFTSSTGDLLFEDNLHDIGASGATRPRDAFIARALIVGATSTSRFDLTVTSVGNSIVNTEGASLLNTTAAVANVTGDDGQQYSPALRWRGQGWKTDATAASQPVDFRAYVVPVQGTAAPTSLWVLESAINDGAYTRHLTVTSAGSLTVGTDLTVTGVSNLDGNVGIGNATGDLVGFYGGTRRAQQIVAKLTESIAGGTSSDDIADPPMVYDQTNERDFRLSVFTKFNAVLDAIGAAGTSLVKHA